MAKELSEKQIKISKAQEYMILAVLGTGVLLGAAVSLGVHFVKQIGFNANVIMAKDEAIVSYSDSIRNIGVCKQPAGDVYSMEELIACDPNSITTDQVPGTLRSNILQGLAANDALSMVSDASTDSACLNEQGKKYSYEELNSVYDSAISSEDRISATNLIKRCSALRLIPDALPSQPNQEALLASLNKVFLLSGWSPDSLAPSSVMVENELPGLESLALNLSVETDTDTVYRVLNNMEHSIREFNIESAVIESFENRLSLHAQATAYWMEPVVLLEHNKTISPDEGATK